MSHPSQIMTFHLTCPESRAWIVLTGDGQESRVVEMEKRNSSVWSASADLTPGEYRCRCYSGDDRNVSYYGPTPIAGGIDCGMDTLLSIKISEEKYEIRQVDPSSPADTRRDAPQSARP
jgi:hypothetical protein